MLGFEASTSSATTVALPPTRFNRGDLDVASGMPQVCDAPGMPRVNAVSSPLRAMDYTFKNSLCSADEERNGGVVDSVVTMSLTNIGIGMLTLPQSYARAGMLPAIVVTIMFAILTDTSLLILVKVAKRTNRYTFEGLADYYLGRWGVRYCNWALIIQLFFLVVAIIDVPTMTVQALVQSMIAPDEHVGYCSDCSTSADCGNLECYTEGSALNGLCEGEDCFCGLPTRACSYIIRVIIALFVIILGVARTFSVIVPISLVGLASVFGALGLFSTLFFQELSAGGAAFTSVKLGPKDQSSLWLVGNLILAFNCQFNILQCFGEMKNPENVYRVVHVTIFAITLPLYLVVGITGMCFVPKDAPQANAFSVLGDSTIAMVAKCLLVVMAIAKGPLLFNPIRDLVIQEFRHLPLQVCKPLTKWKVGDRIGISSFLGVLCFGAASWFSPHRPALMLIGSVCTISTAFVIPALFSIRDTNMHGTILASLGEKPTSPPGFYPEFSMLLPHYKMKLVLGIILAALGALCGIIAMTSEILGLSNPSRVDAPIVWCSGNDTTR